MSGDNSRMYLIKHILKDNRDIDKVFMELVIYPMQVKCNGYFKFLIGYLTIC